MGLGRSLLKMVPMVVVMGTIFLLSHQAQHTLVQFSFPGFDKICHVVIYGALAGAVWYGLPREFKRNRLESAMMLTVMICIVYGISDEFHQSFIPGRDSDPFDLAADATGALLVVLIWNARSIRNQLRARSVAG